MSEDKINPDDVMALAIGIYNAEGGQECEFCKLMQKAKELKSKLELVVEALELVKFNTKWDGCMADKAVYDLVKVVLTNINNKGAN